MYYPLLSKYFTLFAIVLKEYDAAFLPHCSFLFTLWWGCWYANMSPSDKKSLIWHWHTMSGTWRDVLRTFMILTMRGCVAYIHDPDTMKLTFGLKIKLIEFTTWLCVWATAFLSFVKVILCLARECVKVILCLARKCVIVILCLERECVTMIQCIAYIHHLCMTLSVYLNIKILFSL